MRLPNFLIVAVLCGLVSATGCGSAASDVGSVPVTGTVTLDGKPVEGATVAFSPDGEGTARSASGLTDASGTFRLTTVSPGDGAVPGKYKVTVSKVAVSTDTAPRPASQEEAMKQIAQKLKSGGPNAFKVETPPEQMPPRYASPATSGLSGEVKKGGDNKFTFALTTAG